MSFIKSSSVITDIAITVPNMTGGTNGKVVRLSGANLAVDASSADSSILLNSVLIKQNGVYYAGGVVPGFTGLSAGAPYFLNSDGTVTAVAPVPSTIVRTLYIGFALNTTDLLFRPGIPISGT